MKLCNKCLTLFHNQSLNEGEKCPIRSCEGRVVEVDDIMVQSYIILREKNFPVSSICAAQYCQHPFFINFEYSQCKEHFGSIPRGFILFDDGSQLSLNIEVSTDDPIERAKEILKLSEKMLTWAEKLPVLNVLGFGYSYDNKDEAEKMQRYLAKRKIGFQLNIQERNESDYVAYGIRYIKSTDEKAESEKLRSLGGDNCKRFSANIIIDF